MRLIGLNGRLHSGKDTALEFIHQASGYARVRREAFADRIKTSGLAALGIPYDSVEDAVEIANDIKETGIIRVAWVDEEGVTRFQEISGRELWQRYGSEAHREIFDKDFWINAVLPQPIDHFSAALRETRNAERLEERFPSVDIVVITDVRFPNEADRILRLGGEVWVIDAEARLGPLPPGSHASEQPLPANLVTCRVPNNGTIEQFQHTIQAAFDLAKDRR